MSHKINIHEFCEWLNAQKRFNTKLDQAIEKIKVGRFGDGRAIICSEVYRQLFVFSFHHKKIPGDEYARHIEPLGKDLARNIFERLESKYDTTWSFLH